MNVDNILSVWNQATTEELAYGMSWYAVAHTFAAGLAEEFDTTPEVAAGVLAAISPRLAWKYNMSYAHRLFETGDAPLLGLSKAKALRIMGGDAPADVLAAPKGRPNSGQKVRAFFANIVNPAKSFAVTVDRHAWDIAANEIGSDESRKSLDNNGVYEGVAALYREAAAILGVQPHQVQAVTWVAWRRMKGIAD